MNNLNGLFATVRNLLKMAGSQVAEDPFEFQPNREHIFSDITRTNGETFAQLTMIRFLHSLPFGVEGTV